MKRDTRQALIEAGAELVHRQGFARTGLKEILDAAGVPKGSFYFYFPSKEEFGLALIDHCRQKINRRVAALLHDRNLPPLRRLADFFAAMREQYKANGCERGCPIGNLAQEMSDLSPVMREQLKIALDGVNEEFRDVLAEAATRSELSEGLDPDRTAGFLLDAWEGAVMRMKTEKSVEPLIRFEDFVFNHLLG